MKLKRVIYYLYELDADVALYTLTTAPSRPNRRAAELLGSSAPATKVLADWFGAARDLGNRRVVDERFDITLDDAILLRDALAALHNAKSRRTQYGLEGLEAP